MTIEEGTQKSVQLGRLLEPLSKSGNGYIFIPSKKTITEMADLSLLWEEDSVWPESYSTIVDQFVRIVALHLRLIEKRVKSIGERLEAKGFAAENISTLSEYPRQLPTVFHYAAASLGAWLGGTINVQFFAYYAVADQLANARLNEEHLMQMGYELAGAKVLTSSGLIGIPQEIVSSLLEAQGTARVFGSISIDEVNASNPPSESFSRSEIKNDAFSGLLVDKYYRAPFSARDISSYAIYGSKEVLRDHYQNYYEASQVRDLLRCKHYCVPIIDIASVEELRDHVSRIPIRHREGVFFRGQRKMHTLDRDKSVQHLLFGNSCGQEPSLVTSASREIGYDLEAVHFELRHFIENRLVKRGTKAGLARWREKSKDPQCPIDEAILALAQHYGLPSHGLDITTNLDVAIWFATNTYHRGEPFERATYTPLVSSGWAEKETDWPVIIACQCVTNSIEQSLHDCGELKSFGFDAARPRAQSARFFKGGHSDHQNRLAEAVVCVFRLSPSLYTTEATFESLFPPPEKDSAYQLMLDFARQAEKSVGKFINRFH